MKIAIVGVGYVGLVTGVCFSEMGVNVFCVDNDQNKIERLNNGIIPIYEPGLEDLVLKNHQSKRLTFTSDLGSAINEVEVVFCAVGTPSDSEGNADLTYVKSVAKSIGQCLNHHVLVVTKSTVPVGTTMLVKKIIKEII